jgi:hypothetical protein
MILYTYDEYIFAFWFIDRYDQTKAYDHLLIVVQNVFRCRGRNLSQKKRRIVNDNLFYSVFSHLCNTIETHHISIHIARTWFHLFLYLLIY